MSAPSLEVARRLARRHGAANIEFVQHDLLKPLPDRYDVIVSTGVIHHLAAVEHGVRLLADALTNDGFIFVWLYHRYGEFGRLLDRDLALLFWNSLGRPTGSMKLTILKQLGLSVENGRYGINADLPEGDFSCASEDLHAYLEPIVNAYNFEEAFELFKRSGVAWIAPFGVSSMDRSALFDLGDMKSDKPFSISAQALFVAEEAQRTFFLMSTHDQLKAIELALRPTGFSLLAGRGDSFRLLTQRVEGNLVWRAEDSGPEPDGNN